MLLFVHFLTLGSHHFLLLLDRFVVDSIPPTTTADGKGREGHILLTNCYGR